MVDSIDSPWERTTDYDGIYAQAYALWQQGFRYWFDDEENAELERHNRQFEEPNIEEELILTYLRQPYGDEIKNNQRPHERCEVTSRVTDDT